MGEEEQTTKEQLPETVWDEYHGQHVCIQLDRPYYAVTTPGVFAITEEGKVLSVPVMTGLLRIKKDAQGEVRLLVEMADPKQGVQTRVRSEIHPRMVDSISITEQENLVKV